MKTIITTTITLFCFYFNFSQTIVLQSFGTGFSSPVAIAHCGDTRLFVVEQSGNIRILNSDGTKNTTSFLNVSSLISTGGERGLLGLAFHPNYATNGFFYINYTNSSGNTVIARYSVNTTNTNLANANSANIILTITQPYSNHNGGSIKFGPDGFLYIAMGDGGSGGDPQNYAQNKNSLLGKMLRIDVNGTAPYTNPTSNPYIGIDGSDEIWAIGLRNPWKFSFDKSNGDLWIADVGQNNFEEINKVLSTQANLNYGWRCYEGNAAFNTTGCGSLSTFTAPFAVVDHNIGSCSITGGYVYRGILYPNLIGKYLFTDFCNPKIGIVGASGSVIYTSNFTGNTFATFGEDQNGELYVAAINNGTIYKITDSSLGILENVISSFSVYPNPAKNQINIKMLNDNFPTEISIYDLNGRLILKQNTDNQLITAINTTNFSSGTYLINIQSNDKSVSTHKFVIQ